MTVLQAIILGLIQGITEFIPVSSSGHLLLVHNAMGISDNGLAFDVALHIGTFIALILYFHREIRQLMLGILGKNEMKKLAWILVIATIPAVIGGVLLQDLAESTFRSSFLVSINLIWVAFAMIWAENYSSNLKKKSSIDKMSRKQGLIVGFAQVIALIPGVSRSGSTITAGIFAGLDRISATRFSFLLAVPITFGAIVKIMIDSQTINHIGSDAGVFVAGIFSAFISGIFAIRFLIKYLSKHSLNIFAYYRIGLGLVVLLLLAR
ncbi:undecaprenyl-diphosphatase UppP [Candidatus Saccharibacteria bacterium]|nr:undecaprenyl-diphosphatase UppP [Candidatus Saccharibacteria bacterium]